MTKKKTYQAPTAHCVTLTLVHCLADSTSSTSSTGYSTSEYADDDTERLSNRKDYSAEDFWGDM